MRQTVSERRSVLREFVRRPQSQRVLHGGVQPPAGVPQQPSAVSASAATFTREVCSVRLQNATDCIQPYFVLSTSIRADSDRPHVASSDAVTRRHAEHAWASWTPSPLAAVACQPFFPARFRLPPGETGAHRPEPDRRHSRVTRALDPNERRSSSSHPVSVWSNWCSTGALVVLPDG